MLDAVQGTSEQSTQMLINLSRRRDREFLKNSEDIPQPLFELCNPLTLQVFSDELQVSTPERAISILRSHASRLELGEDECIIKYSDATRSESGSRFGYATALPQLPVNLAGKNSTKVHKR